MREPDQLKALAKRYPPLETIFQMLKSGCCLGVCCKSKHSSAARPLYLPECPFCGEAKLEPFCAFGGEPGLKSFSLHYKATMRSPSIVRACETVEAYVKKICEGRRLFSLIEPTGKHKAKTVGMLIGSGPEGTRLHLAIPGRWRYTGDTEFELHANLEDLVEVNFLGIELRNFRTLGKSYLEQYEYKQRKAFERKLAVRWEPAESPADVAKPSAEDQLRAAAGLYTNHECEEALLASLERVIDNESIYSRRKRLLD